MTVKLRIDVPRKKHGHKLVPRYISASTQSLVWDITFAGNPVTGGGGYVNVTQATKICTQGGIRQNLTCTVTLKMAPQAGTYVVNIFTFDAQQSGSNKSSPCPLPSTTGCAGNVLSQASVAQNLTAGANAISLVLGGIPARMLATPLTNSFLRGDVNGLTLWGPSQAYLSVVALDADDNIIVGPGAPTLHQSSSSAKLKSQVDPQMQPYGTVVSMQATTSGTPPAVTPGTVNMTLTLTPSPDSGDSTVLSTTVPVTIAHYAIYVSTQAGQVVGFFDGNTGTPNFTLSDPADIVGIAIDANGTLYVADFLGNAVNAYAAGATSPFRTISTGVNRPLGVAVDARGTLYVANSGNNTVTEYPVAATSPTFTLHDSSLNAPTALAVDALGTLYVANNGSSTVTEYRAGAHFPSLTISDGVSSPSGVAVDSSGTVYVSNSATAAVTEYAAGSTSMSGVTLTNGLSDPYYDAVDTLGGVIVVSHGNGVVVRYDPGATSPSMTIPSSSLSGPEGLAVVPASVMP